MKHCFHIIVFLVIFSCCKRVGDDFVKYQTFDEYKMCGIGEAVDTPFVYVKRVDNSILVRTTNMIDTIIQYDNHGSFWYSCRRYGYGDSYMCQCNDWQLGTPRVYHRFFYNDTILEYYEVGDEDNRNLFVKTVKDLLIFSVKHAPDEHDINEMFQYLKSLAQTASFDCSLTEDDEVFFCGIDIQGAHYYMPFIRLNKEVRDGVLSYHNVIDNGIWLSDSIWLDYRLNNLGEYGIQPGIVEHLISDGAMKQEITSLERQ